MLGILFLIYFLFLELRSLFLALSSDCLFFVYFGLVRRGLWGQRAIICANSSNVCVLELICPNTSLYSLYGFHLACQRVPVERISTLFFVTVLLPSVHFATPLPPFAQHRSASLPGTFPLSLRFHPRSVCKRPRPTRSGKGG